MLNLRIKARWRQYLANRKLAKSGYTSWSAYRRNNDSSVCYHADKVSDFYSGYKYVYRCENPDHFAYTTIYDYGPGGYQYGYHVISDWCEDKCRFKYRMDFHRVLKQTGLGINGEEYPEWYFNDIGGTDYIYVAFQNERDYMMFLLRWS